MHAWMGYPDWQHVAVAAVAWLILLLLVAAAAIELTLRPPRHH
jgi:hypothetical protein